MDDVLLSPNRLDTCDKTTEQYTAPRTPVSNACRSTFQAGSLIFNWKHFYEAKEAENRAWAARGSEASLKQKLLANGMTLDNPSFSHFCCLLLRSVLRRADVTHP